MNPLSIITHFAASAIKAWQLQNNACMATVFEKISARDEGFIAAGRSLKEIEMGECDFLKPGIACIACVGVLLACVLIQAYYSKKL